MNFNDMYPKEISKKYFSDELRDIMKKRMITYIDLSRMSNVSISYLTKILVHKVTPSPKIMNDIACSLKINPRYFMEYRIA